MPVDNGAGLLYYNECAATRGNIRKRKNGKMNGKRIEITGEKYERIIELKRTGVPEWRAVAIVLEIDENESFVVNSLGSSSNPSTDGFVVTFI